MATKKKASKKKTIVKKTVLVARPKKRKAKRKKVSAPSFSVATIKSTVKKEGSMAAKKKGQTKRRRPKAKAEAESSKIMDTVMSALYGLAAGVGLSIVANKLPIADARVKAALPIAGGFGILAIPQGEGKPDMKAAAAVSSAAIGSMIVGGLSMVRALAPTIPMLAGEDDYILLPADSLSGDYKKLSGNYNRISGPGTRHLSPASVG